LDLINMRINELHNQPVKPDTYEASMAQNQLLKIGTHSIQLHNLIKDDQEMESWVAKKIDLASNYVKSVHGYMAGSKAGAYDDNGMTENKINEEQSVRISTDVEGEWGGVLGKLLDRDDDGNVLVGFGKEAHWFKQDDVDFDLDAYGSGADDDDVLDPEFDEDAGEKIANMAQNMSKDEFIGHADELGLTPEEAAEYYEKMSGGAHAGKFEDAGEGHMSKSQLYHTAKMSIELIEMINAGDDLEAWVQTKLNLAADYLQGVHHYEEYQKLNPYREQIDSNTFAKHSEIVKKNIDEILSKETKIDDIDTKPGMLKILGKRVNEVEKEIAKENRKANEEAAGVGIITKQNTTADVKPGDEYKNVKKLGLKAGAYESKLTDMLNQRLK
tara:strand:+ start:251 stop:1405 length:1155 start_codon:yes stop_codon:yes gene_type:complete